MRVLSRPAITLLLTFSSGIVSAAGAPPDPQFCMHSTQCIQKSGEITQRLEGNAEYMKLFNILLDQDILSSLLGVDTMFRRMEADIRDSHPEDFAKLQQIPQKKVKGLLAMVQLAFTAEMTDGKSPCIHTTDLQTKMHTMTGAVWIQSGEMIRYVKKTGTLVDEHVKKIIENATAMPDVDVPDAATKPAMCPEDLK